MAKKKAPAKKRNPQDATMRNVRHANKEANGLKQQVGELVDQVRALAVRVEKCEQRCDAAMKAASEANH